MFAIEVVESPLPWEAIDPTSQATGRITVGDFSETFDMSLAFWCADKYRDSWRQALQVLEGDMSAVSCLVSSITDPANSNFILCWPLYRKGDQVHVQNAVVFMDELAEEFDPVRPWRSVQPWSAVDEDGNNVSDWLTSMSEIRRFRDSGALD